MAERKSTKELSIDDVELNDRKAEKEKALAETFKAIEKSYGKGSIMRLGDVVNEKIEVISSGSISLDAAITPTEITVAPRAFAPIASTVEIAIAASPSGSTYRTGLFPA